MTGENRPGNMELIFYMIAYQKYIETQARVAKSSTEIIKVLV